MSLIIQKFGGTSVGSLERIQEVAAIIAQTQAAGHTVVVVVSAMAGETDKLIRMANQLSLNPNSREFDALVSTGECVSAALLAIALNAKNIPACSLTGRQAQIATTDDHRRAKITHIATDAIQKILSQKKIPIITGFQGVNRADEVTTLERGGSDTSAVAIAAALKADECHIYTDVAGVYTADPRIVPDARLLEKMSYGEMLALSCLGAKVLHQQAVEFAQQHHIPLRILSSFEHGAGTIIAVPLPSQEAHVSGIAYALAAESQTTDTQDRVKLSLVGLGMTSHPRFASKIFHTLTTENIPIYLITSTEAEISTIIDREHLSRATQLLHQAFELSADIKG